MKIDPWHIECDLTDGARLRRLRHEGIDLLTAPPAAFRPPRADLGRYETRPVFGYDDCWPTVDPHGDWPDHGELCWLPWQGTALDAQVTSPRTAATFRRRLEFGGRTLRWSFSLHNPGPAPLSFLHVMHALLPLDRIASIELPAGTSVFDERARQPVAIPWIERFLLGQPTGSAQMLLIRGVSEGCFRLGLTGGRQLTVRYPADRFPTLGIWWNRGGYPDEEGGRRTECAFEPISGPTSSLGDGSVLAAAPGQTVDWQVTWEITRR